MSSFFMVGAEERVGQNNQLLKLNSLIQWSCLKVDLVGLHKNERDSQGGPIPYDALKMYKAVLLGQWHGLSDEKLEESLRVRLDFMLFTGFELDAPLPDATTLCRFRNKLVELGLEQALFEEINRQLGTLGLEVHSARGALVDATVIESAARPRRTLTVAQDRAEEEQPAKAGFQVQVAESVDPDARWLKKGKRSYFGYKGFVRVAEGSGFIQAVGVTPANAAEVHQLPGLVKGLEEKTAVYTDKAYVSADNEAYLERHQLKSRIMYKAHRHQPLTHWQKVFNRGVSQRRFRVEQAFGTLKRRFGFRRASYLTLQKVLGQWRLKATCFNLLKAVNQCGMLKVA